MLFMTRINSKHRAITIDSDAMDIFSDQTVAGQFCGSVHSMKKKCLKITGNL